MADSHSHSQRSSEATPEVITCPKCGVEVSEQAGRCPRCQTVIDPSHAKTPSEQQAEAFEPEGG